MAVSSNSRTTIARSVSVIRLLLAGTILFAWTSASADPRRDQDRLSPRPTAEDEHFAPLTYPREQRGCRRTARDQRQQHDRQVREPTLLAEDVQLNDKDDPAAAASSLAARGVSLVPADLPAAARCSRPLMHPAHKACCSSMSVRSTTDCARKTGRGNVIHTAPTRSMLADALAQYLV